MGEYVNFDMEILFDSEKNADKFCNEEDLRNFLGCGVYFKDGKLVSCKIYDVWQKSDHLCKEQIKASLKTVLEKHRDEIRHFQFWISFPERAPEEEIKFEKIIGDEAEK
jgi:hypothetical protein